MPNPKLDALQRQQSYQERLFGKDAPAVTPPPPEAAETPPAEGDLIRKSYRILRGRIEMLPSLQLKNRQGQARIFPWSNFGGANCDHPGELVLIFDGPEGSCQVALGGLGLDGELQEGVMALRVEWIQELSELEVAAVRKADPTEPVVTGIWIAGGGREWSRIALPPR